MNERILFYYYEISGRLVFVPAFEKRHFKTRENWYSVLTLPFIGMNHMGVPRCQGQNVHDFSFENHEIQTDIFSRKVCSTLSSLTIGRLAQLKEGGRKYF